MPSSLPEHTLVTLLRQCYITPRCHASRARSTRLLHSSARALQPLGCRPRHRNDSATTAGSRHTYHTSGSEFEDRSLGGSSRIGDGVLDSNTAVRYSGGEDGEGRPPQTKIAIVGGGITGLTAAHYITRVMPHVKVTIYEAGSRVGGWLQSETVDVEGGQILFEKGPRTLRPGTDAALVTLDMIQELKLEKELLVSWKDSPAARNRFVYYPDHLVKMPGPGQGLYDMAWTMITEPAFKGLWDGVFEYRRPPRASDVEDESVASLIARRSGGPHIGNNLVSAVLHGIYAGDIEKLSAKSLMPVQYHMEKSEGSLMWVLMKMRENGFAWQQVKDYELRQELGTKVEDLTDDLTIASVFSFKKGIGALTDALEKSLRANSNVQFRTNDPIKSLRYDVGTNSIEITSATTSLHTRAISTISSTHLSALSAPNTLQNLSLTPTVTVMVVNLYYPQQFLLPEQGFGYLIPRSIPYAQNPECALGVVFDSDAISGQDTVKGTKVTVMLGGHWWDSFSSSEFPDEEEGVSMAREVLKRHLKISEEPAVTRVSLQRDCIPQYTVGHESRMGKAHEEIKDTFKGKLAVAGNAYTGVGLNDCVRAARDVVMRIKEGEAVTGLEEFTKPESSRWRKVFRKTGQEVAREVERKMKREIGKQKKEREKFLASLSEEQKKEYMAGTGEPGEIKALHKMLDEHMELGRKIGKRK